MLAQKGYRARHRSTASASILLLFPMWVVFLISSMAETFRTPFDLVEAESELVAGHQTEYSSMSFALFWLGEYANVILMCALNALLFWGGWLPPVDWAPLYWIPGWIWLFGKMCFFFFVLRLGEGDGAALPLRPADAARLEDLPAAVAALRRPRLGLADADALWRARHDRAPIKSFTLWEFVKAHALTLEIFLQAQGDDQLPVREDADRARASAASMRCAAIPMARSAASRANCARRSARRWRSPSRPSRARTAAAAPRATTSTWSNASIAACARRRARWMRSSKGRTSNSRPKRARNCSTTRPNCSPTATSGSRRSPPTLPPMRPIDRRAATGSHA